MRRQAAAGMTGKLPIRQAQASTNHNPQVLNAPPPHCSLRSRTCARTRAGATYCSSSVVSEGSCLLMRLNTW